MELIEQIKSKLDQKHADLFNGTSENVIKNVDVHSDKAFKKYSSFKKRLKNENEGFNKGLRTIKKNEKDRRKEEESARAKAAEETAEKERLERQREEQRRREREAALQREAAAREERSHERRNAIERVFQVVFLFGPAILVIVNAIILFSNMTQLKMRGAFTGCFTGWCFFLLGTVVLTIVFAKKIFGDWDVEDKQTHVTSGLFAGATIVALIITICVSSANVKSNFNPATLISVKATGKTTSEGYNRVYSTISFSLKNTSDINVGSVSGSMDFYNGGTLLSKYNVTFNGTFYAGESYTSTVEFEEDSSNAYLYNASFSSLAIKWKVTSVYAGNANCSVDGPTVDLK